MGVLKSRLKSLDSADTCLFSYNVVPLECIPEELQSIIDLDKADFDYLDIPLDAGDAEATRSEALVLKTKVGDFDACVLIASRAVAFKDPAGIESLRCKLRELGRSYSGGEGRIVIPLLYFEDSDTWLLPWASAKLAGGPPQAA